MLQGPSHDRRDRRLARRAPSTPEEGRIITNVRGLVVLASMQVEDAAVLRGDAAVARRAQHVSSCDYYVDDDGTRRERMDELSARIRAGADDGSKLKLPIDKSATMLLAAASYPKFCALMRQRCKAVLKERAAFDALR